MNTDKNNPLSKLTNQELESDIIKLLDEAKDRGIRIEALLGVNYEISPEEWQIALLKDNMRRLEALIMSIESGGVIVKEPEKQIAALISQKTQIIKNIGAIEKKIDGDKRRDANKFKYMSLGELVKYYKALKKRIEEIIKMVGDKSYFEDSNES
jgi:Uri superfamily endonuclease